MFHWTRFHSISRGNRTWRKHEKNLEFRNKIVYALGSEDHSLLVSEHVFIDPSAPLLLPSRR
jgi:hypothetical protein